LGEDYDNRENILLMKGDTLRMAEYFVTYKGKVKEGVNIFYEVEYLTQPSPSVFEHAFTLMLHAFKPTHVWATWPSPTRAISCIRTSTPLLPMPKLRSPR
jgi:hypothetical protein